MSESCQTRRMFGHDYAVPGTYEVTIVVAGRRPVFGEVVGTTKAGGEKPHLKPSPLGQAVLDNELPKIHHYYPMVEVWQVCLMPDHLHLIVGINQPLPKGKHLGIIIGAFKGGISRAWWQLEPTVSAASAGDSRPPLFEPNYNDHILMRDGQLANWKSYLNDNPFRYMMRREYPDLFQRALCVTIGNTRYSAFGNMLFLRQPEKHQVFFHRRTDGVPTEDTEFWQTEKKRLISAANSGDVLVASDYERFHYLNRLAETICAIGHTTNVSVQGLRPPHSGQ